MKTFKLVRKHDISGVSGTGIVAEGVEFHDGQCVMSWFGQHHTLEVSPTIESIIAIHGHDGATEVVYDVDYKPDPSCHACGGPISVGDDIDIYHHACRLNYD